MRYPRIPCCNHRLGRRPRPETCFHSNTRDCGSSEAALSTWIQIHLRVLYAKDAEPITPCRAKLCTQIRRHAVVGKRSPGQSPHVVHEVLVAAFRVVSPNRRFEGRRRRDGKGRIVVNVNQRTSTTVSRYVPWACVVALIFELSAVSVLRIAIHKVAAIAPASVSRCRPQDRGSNSLACKFQASIFVMKRIAVFLAILDRHAGRVCD